MDKLDEGFIAREMARFDQRFALCDLAKCDEVIAGRRRYCDSDIDKMFTAWLAALPDASPDSGEGVDSPADLLAHLRRIPMTEWVWSDAERIFATLATLAASPEAPANRQEAGEVEVAFEVWQGDELAAASSDEKDGWHYLAVYEQDGPATLVRAETRRTTLTSPKDVKGEGA